MSLRDQALEDLTEIMNDEDTGGDPCTITSPAGVTDTFSVFNNNISLQIDPETGVMVSGQQATIAVLIHELMAAGFGDIRGIADPNAKPWVVEIADVNGVMGRFKVVESHPDRSSGLNTLFLEIYQ